jgi:hypothetical protein
MLQLVGIKILSMTETKAKGRARPLETCVSCNLFFSSFSHIKLRPLQTPIILTAKMKSRRRDGSVRSRKQLWRSRKRLRRKKRRNATTMTTTTTRMRMSTPPYRSHSGRTTWVAPSHLSEASISVPNARNSSPWCAFSVAMSFPSYLRALKTKYTMAADPPPGYLCHSCAKASGADPFKKPPAPRKRKSAAERRNITNLQETKFPTLVSLCIKASVLVRC